MTHPAECKKIHMYSVTYDYVVNTLVANVQDTKWDIGCSSEAPTVPLPN